MRRFIIILVAAFAIFGVKAQEQTSNHSVVVDIPFLQGEGDREGMRYDFDSLVLAKSLDELRVLGENRHLKVKRVVFYSSVSPEGTISFNRKLGKQRIATAESIVRERLRIGDDVAIEYDERYIPWHDYLLPAIEADTTVPYRDQLMRLIYRRPDAKGADRRRIRLKRAMGGKLWRVVAERYFEHMRKGGAVITVASLEFDEVVDSDIAIAAAKPTLTDAGIADNAKQLASQHSGTAEPLAAEPQLGFRLKTNALGWLCSQANVAIEFDVADRWSLSLPIYYGAMDYFKSSIKMRTFNIRPEVRYYLLNNRRLFVGAHFTMAYFNFALNGKYRYQDAGRESPALGGGLIVGYRLPLSKRSDRWAVEFFAGAGVYDVKYDMLENVPNGAYVDSAHKTFIGLDNVGVSFSYKFNYKKRSKR